MDKKIDNYSIGLDIGTNSVGWAVVDNDYHILKYQGKNMWGARLFDEGETAHDRRMSRNSRRRIKRRRQRISLLRELIGEMVIAKDPNFFMHLDKAFLTKSDKGYENNLFNDENFNDHNYYKKYETIYHLRKELCTSKEKADPRLIYLALHHILKYRGNFLYEGQKFEITNNEQVLFDLSDALKMIFSQHDVEINLTDESLIDILKILLDHNQKKAIKKDALISYLCKRDKDAKKVATEIANLLLGYEANLSKIFPLSNIQKEDKDYKTNFDSTKYEDDLDFIESSLQNDFEALQNLHNVYSFSVLQKILKGEVYISDAMILKYKNHQKDLKELKKFLKEKYSLNEYNAVFRDENTAGNYVNYIHNARKTSREDFYAFVKKILSNNENIVNDPTYIRMMDKIDRDEYFQRQNAKDNGAIPYQMHEKELLEIINHQEQFYPILKENKDKLLSIISFRIPYYIGPLNSKNNSKFHWIVRDYKERLTPWNFNDHVDVLASAEGFIRRMTNQCTYLLSEDVLAKNSLLYTKFEVFNELNKIRVKTRISEKPQLLSQDAKDAIICDVFMMRKKVKEDDLQKYLINKGWYAEGDIIEITGFQKDKEFATSLTPWIDFKKIYQGDFETAFVEIEKIIEWISVYEDKKILKKRLETEMPHLKDRIPMILKLRYKGWGRLSRKLLSELRIPDKDGNFISIIDCLEQSSNNFMQIINDKKLGFNKLIDKENEIDDAHEITYDMVNELQGSPALKKGIWQTILIVKELVKVMKKEPDQIFIEFARNEDEKKRTVSKVKRLQDIYAALKKDGLLDDVNQEASNALNNEDKNKALLSEKLNLYYIQEGKCLYSGKPLNIHELNTYQVDHILPQSYIKDDSIDNKALVYAELNQYKGDQLLMSYNTVNKQKTWWNHLLKYELISSKKFKNLMRTSMSEMEEMSFINRQLVETRQITKHVANLLKTSYKDSSVVAIKASLSSYFRDKYELYKIRDINDYHHAQDAYLACTIGTFLMRKYPALKNEFIFTEYLQLGNFKKILSEQKNGFGFVINQMGQDKYFETESGELIWNGNESLQQVLSVFDYKDCFITKKPEEKRGQFFNLTIDKLDKTKKSPIHKLIPINKNRSDISKYGGFSGLMYAYGVAVEYPYKKKIKRTIFNVPRHLMNDEKGLLDFLKKEAETDDIKILKDKILFNQLFEYEGGFYTMGSANEWNNARQLLLSKKTQKIVYNALNGNDVSEEGFSIFYDEYVEKLDKFYPLMKNVSAKLKANRLAFLNSKNKPRIITELLKITKANPSDANLKFDDFEIGQRVGRMGGKIFDLSEVWFIYQSITGLFVNRYKL